MVGQSELLLHLLGQPVLVGVVQLDVERRKPTQHRQTDPTGSDGTDLHSLEVVGALDTIGDVPATPHDPAVGRDVVAHERQNHHDDVF